MQDDDRAKENKLLMKLLITGGGTGGHVFPGIAVARELMSRTGEHQVLFVGAQRGVENVLAPKAGFDIETLEITGLKGKGVFQVMKSLGLLAKAVAQARKIISRFEPDAVLGVGGYASGPVGIATFITRTPLAIAEQNAAPGLTNRWLGMLAKKIFVTWPNTESAFPKKKTVVTGNPVRPEFFEVKEMRDDQRFTVFITGGSQGARSINNATVEAIKALNSVAGKIKVVHQAGPDQSDSIRGEYVHALFPYELEDFFHDMPQRIAEADLVISRAGAGAVAEICAVGRAALYIPFPYAADDHQTKNAETMVRAGAALMMPDSALNGVALAATVLPMEKNRVHVEKMAEKAKEFAKPNAASQITDGLFDISEGAA